MGDDPGDKSFTRLAWKRKRELVQEMVFYKKRFWKSLGIIIQRYRYPTYKPMCFSLNTCEASRYCDVPFSHPLCGWYMAGWLWDNWTGTAPPGWLWDNWTGTAPPGWLWDNWTGTAPPGGLTSRAATLQLWFLLWYPRLSWIPSGPVWLRLWSSPLPMASPPSGPDPLWS